MKALAELTKAIEFKPVKFRSLLLKCDRVQIPHSNLGKMKT